MENISPSISHSSRRDAGEQHSINLAVPTSKHPTLSSTSLATIVISTVLDNIRGEKMGEKGTE